ncbi:MAG TPA: sigma-70 family RNA polymerase sigma factor [Gaiellales bacterium]|nr:sigma-70 family RNA polymerase sigma factor [Gaiellales bacterium]
MGDGRDAAACSGLHARSAGVAAWAARPRARRERRPASPDDDVDDAYRALRATVARGLAYRMGSSDLAEDLTQDVFVDLLLASRCHPPDNTRAWLARVAQRHVADTIGSAVRERAARAQLEASSRGAPADRSADTEMGLEIRACVARLSEPQQQIVALRLVQGLSFAHCGLRLGMSEDAARMRFRRALGALRVELGQAGVERR